MKLKENDMPLRQRNEIESIEQDFNEAIDRLLAGKPRDNHLRKLYEEDRLRITPTTVSREAKRSRTLIAMEDCRLPNIRRRIEAVNALPQVIGARTASAVIKDLREQVLSLRRELAAALEGQAEHFLARELAEREASKWRDAVKRQARQEEEDAKVRSIRPPKPRT